VHRLNTSFYLGGPQGVTEAITRLYKIRVDKYITVDFKSFPKLINALGGVTVDVTEAEARYINRTAPSQNKNFPSGNNVRLTGKQALLYSRIRKLDSDIERTGRQQKVIESIIKSAKGASLAQIYHALDDTLGYLQTNYTKPEILSLVPSAMGWLNYGVQHISMPVLEEPGANAIFATVDAMSVLLVDYPLAARQVQLALYGESNINVDDDHMSYLRNLFRAAEDSASTVSVTTAPAATTQPPTLTTAPALSPPTNAPEEPLLTEPSETTDLTPTQGPTQATRWPWG
jgi:LCP family protein required for cell wall assembly